jgi:hypothetical protein
MPQACHWSVAVQSPLIHSRAHNQHDGRVKTVWCTERVLDDLYDQLLEFMRSNYLVSAVPFIKTMEW